jgi:hypothetical protein
VHIVFRRRAYRKTDTVLVKPRTDAVAFVIELKALACAVFVVVVSALQIFPPQIRRHFFGRFRFGKPRRDTVRSSLFEPQHFLITSSLRNVYKPIGIKIKLMSNEVGMNLASNAWTCASADSLP